MVKNSSFEAGHLTIRGIMARPRLVIFYLVVCIPLILVLRGQGLCHVLKELEVVVMDYSL